MERHTLVAQRVVPRAAWRVALLATLLVAGGALACAPQSDPPPPTLGQWIWNSRDSALLQDSRRQRADLRAGIWVATLARRGDSLVTELGRPVDASAGPDAEVVIRFDDSFSTWWGKVPVDTLANWVALRLQRVLPLVDGSAPDRERRAVQLDYDAPVARLAEYAALLRRLRDDESGLPHERTLRITSLISHLRHPEYGSLFRPLVDGHIVQLFDTGERHDAVAEGRLLELLDAARIPFHIGVGSFERRLSSGMTTHRDWFAILPRAAQSRWFRGTWIFPAGSPYLQYLAP